METSQLIRVDIENPSRGTIYLLGPEAHIEVNPLYHKRWFSRKIFNDTVGMQIKKYGYSITACTKESKNIDFIKKLGYEVVIETDSHLIFKMTRNKYET